MDSQEHQDLKDHQDLPPQKTTLKEHHLDLQVNLDSQD